MSATYSPPRTGKEHCNFNCSNPLLCNLIVSAIKSPLQVWTTQVKKIIAFKLGVLIIGEYHVPCPRVIAIISLILHFILAIYFIFLTLRFSFVSKSHNLMLLPAESSVSPLGPSSMHLTPSLSAFHLLQKTKHKFINKFVINFREGASPPRPTYFADTKWGPASFPEQNSYTLSKTWLY